MCERVQVRAAYGRVIRDRADCMLEAHGPGAITEALRAAREPGVADADRCFWEAVAARVARQLGQRETVRA